MQILDEGPVPQVPVLLSDQLLGKEVEPEEQRMRPRADPLRVFNVALQLVQLIVSQPVAALMSVAAARRLRPRLAAMTAALRRECLDGRLGIPPGGGDGSANALDSGTLRAVEQVGIAMRCGRIGVP
jgi:hypothetical protein